MSKIDRALSLSFLLSLLLVPARLAAQAQPQGQASSGQEKGKSLSALPRWIETATVDLDFKNADMPALLDKIHEETGITLTREGVPIRANLTLTYHGPLKDALDKIADRFDYVWRPSQKLTNTLLFMKRYRSLDAHPEWRETEMLRTAEQVCRALQSPLAISEAYGNTRDLLQLLYHKFSPTQLQTLNQGGQLSFSDLDAAQALLLSQQIYSVALRGTKVTWEQLQSRLAHLKDAKLVFRPSDGYTALTLVFPPTVGGTTDSAIVRYYKAEDLAPGAPEASAVPINQERAAPLFVQMQKSEEQSPLQQRMDIRMQGGPLADLLSELSQQSGCKIAAASYLIGERLSLWTKGCSLRVLMDLLAEQHDWQWDYTSAGGIRISRRDTFIPANLAEVSAAFQIALPIGYRHFLGLGVPTEDWLKGNDDPRLQIYINTGQNVEAMHSMLIKKVSRSAYDDPTMLRIWPTQPQSFESHTELAYKDWNSQTKEAILWSLFTIAMRGLMEDRCLDVISGRLAAYEKDPSVLRIHLAAPDEKGKYHLFGYSSATVNANGTQRDLGGFFWTLENASAPLPPPLEEVFRRY